MILFNFDELHKTWQCNLKGSTVKILIMVFNHPEYSKLSYGLLESTLAPLQHCESHCCVRAWGHPQFTLRPFNLTGFYLNLNWVTCKHLTFLLNMCCRFNEWNTLWFSLYEVENRFWFQTFHLFTCYPAFKFTFLEAFSWKFQPCLKLVV